MKRTIAILAALALAAGGCGDNDSPAGEGEPVMTGEETTLSPQELNDEERTGELPEKEPAKQDNETTG